MDHGGNSNSGIVDEITTTLAKETNNPSVPEEKPTPSSPSTAIAAKKKVKKRKQCEFEGCAKTSQQGGRCKTHGAKRKQCEFGDCTRISIQHGLCIPHGELLTDEQKRKIAIETAEREKKRKSTAVTSKNAGPVAKETADRKAKETADRKAKGVERKRKRKENREVRLSSSSSSSWM